MRQLLLYMVVLQGCRGGIGRTCETDDECRESLRCLSSICTTREVKETVSDGTAATAIIERVRVFLKDRFHMSDATVAGLCFAGEAAIIVRDKAHGWEFCLQPKNETFEVVYSGAFTATPCNGMLGEAMRLGDAINRCR